MESKTLNKHWAETVNVLFGTIAAIAFLEFHKSFSAMLSDHECHWPYIVLRLSLFLSVFSFYLYDWNVYQVLLEKHPFKKSPPSGARFLTDVAMNFCLMGVVWNAAGNDKLYNNPFIILYFLSTWHLLSAFWHFLSKKDAGNETVFDESLQWHLFCAHVIYWGPCLVVYFVLKNCAPSWTSEGILISETIAIFVTAIYRAKTVLLAPAKTR